MLGLPDTSRIILFVGRIEPLKGIETLLRAIAQIAPQIPRWQEDLRVIIIGGAPGVGIDKVNSELARLERLRANLGLEELVTFQGAEDQDRLVYYYSAAEMAVMPSHYESFGMVALEAMACGTPVIASQVGGLAFLIKDGETGYHVPDQDPEALCDKLLLLLSDPHQRETMGLRAAKHARDYAWANIASQMMDVYKSLVEGKEGVVA